MSLWRTLQLLAVAAIGVQAEATVSNRTNSLEAVSILGGSAPGNVAACYAPFHNAQYPLFGGAADVNALRAAIEDDFRLMAKYFTHAKTYYSQHYGIELAPIAKKYGLKLYLGVYMTKESWMNDEIKAAANAIKQYSDTVEVVLAGNENMVNFQTHSWEIIDVVNRVKSAAGGDAWRVKYGTVQRITEYMDNSFNGEVQQLKDSLDILGVNIYPFFNNNYDGNNPTALLDAQWKAVTAKWGRDKFRLTETGFPTAGAPSSLSPRVQPSLDNSFKYYEGLLNWWPQGSEAYPKFWFQAFDRRYGDPAAPVDLERYFGFFTTEKWTKRDNYPRLIGSSTGSSCTIENGVDYAGNDITSASASRAEACFAICNAQSGCSAFTWTSYNGGTCWLKSGKGATSSNSDARSAITCRCNLGGLEPSVDYVGNDIGSAAEASAEDCIGACQRFNGCRVFSWNGYAGGTCYLKSGKGATTSNSAVVSGVIC